MSKTRVARTRPVRQRISVPFQPVLDASALIIFATERLYGIKVIEERLTRVVSAGTNR